MNLPMNLPASQQDSFKITKNSILLDKRMLKVNNQMTRMILYLFKVINIGARATSIDAVPVSLFLISNLLRHIVESLWGLTFCEKKYVALVYNFTPTSKLKLSLTLHRFQAKFDVIREHLLFIIWYWYEIKNNLEII